VLKTKLIQVLLDTGFSNDLIFIGKGHAQIFPLGEKGWSTKVDHLQWRFYNK